MTNDELMAQVAGNIALIAQEIKRLNDLLRHTLPLKGEPVDLDADE